VEICLYRQPTDMAAVAEQLWRLAQARAAA